jgi:hypothetical protein
MWFSMSLSYMDNHMVFKVNHMVQDQPWTTPTPYYLKFAVKKVLPQVIDESDNIEFF